MERSSRFLPGQGDLTASFLFPQSSTKLLVLLGCLLHDRPTSPEAETLNNTFVTAASLASGCEENSSPSLSDAVTCNLKV